MTGGKCVSPKNHRTGFRRGLRMTAQKMQMNAVTNPRSSINLRQVVLITLAAVAVFVGLRSLPTGTNLSHMDFRATGANVIEFCDPLNPQFISVVAARSPV